MNGCSSDTSNHVYISGSDPSGIKPGIIVYPIPNNGQFSFSITLLDPEIFDISMYNNLGQKVYELNDLTVVSRVIRKVDLRPMSRGVYSMVFRCKDYRTVIKVLIDKR